MVSEQCIHTLSFRKQAQRVGSGLKRRIGGDFLGPAFEGLPRKQIWVEGATGQCAAVARFS